MKSYDIIVIGSGAGGNIVSSALQENYTVAWVDKGPLGGTCLNVGCIPSKMIIYPADRITEIQQAYKLGIKAKVTHIDFSYIMTRMRDIIHESQSHIRQGLQSTGNLDFYETQGYFIDEYTLWVPNKKIQGDKIFIASGARPLIPPVKGIEKIPYFTNDTVFDITTRPKSLIILGGGYIAVEFAHFFSAMGTQVTILQRNPYLVKNEEREISKFLKMELEKRMEIYTSMEAIEVTGSQKGITVTGRHTKTNEVKKFQGEKLLVAAGRKSNADLLHVEKTGVHTDKRGYIKVNDYLETSKKNIWALGDATGHYMFRHVANREASQAWHNATQTKKFALDYTAIPHAIFTYPQIASVGLGEKEAQKKYDILIGTARYSDVAKGEAMNETQAFAKAIVEKQTGKILGFHIIGPYAPILIQEVITVMATTETLMSLAQGMHIHPALPELILATFSHLHDPSNP
jgi:dihydrolipoamide dehydrogenase